MGLYGAQQAAEQSPGGARVISCREAVERLWFYLDGTLERADERELEAHLELCRQCCGKLEFARRIQRLLRQTASGVGMPEATRVRLNRVLEGLGGGHE